MNRGRKKILSVFGIFLAVMLLCTCVSRGIYSSQLPQVTVQTPQSMVLEHRVEAVGQVQTQRQLAFLFEPGFLVKEVLVMAGDQIVEGQPIFILDTEELSEKLNNLEKDIEKLSLQIWVKEKSEQMEEKSRNREILRTQEDVESVLLEAEKQILRAQEDEAKAKEKLKAHEKKEFWKEAEGGDELLKQQVYDAWEAERQVLAEQVTQAARVLEDAVDAAQDIIRESTRMLENSGEEAAPDAELELLRMELQLLEEEKNGLQEWMNVQGIVCAEAPGTVLQVNISPGTCTNLGPALLYADTGSGLQFTAQITREQKKYVQQEASAVLSLGSSRNKRMVTVDYLTETGNGDGSWQVICKLENTGDIVYGQNGTLTITVPTENHGCCVPLRAVFQDSLQQTFVYVLSETETILGKELTVQKCMVKILDQNENYAALSAESLSESAVVVTETTKEIAAGDVVRLKE